MVHTEKTRTGINSTCPRFPLLLGADWACWADRKNGRLDFSKPFEDVSVIWLSQSHAATPPTKLSKEVCIMHGKGLQRRLSIFRCRCRVL